MEDPFSIMSKSRNNLTDFKYITNFTKLELNTNLLDEDNNKETKFVSYLSRGRLGNNIFQYVCAYTTAKKTGFIPVIDTNSSLLQIFPHIKAKRVNKKTFLQLKFKRIRNPSRPLGFNKHLMQQVIDAKKTNRNIQIVGYHQSWIYAKTFEVDIRQQLQIANYINNNVLLKFYEIKQTFSTKMAEVNITYIGVHVRRTDMVHRSLCDGICTPHVTYLLKAINYYKSSYKNTVFLIASDDITWCIDKLHKHNNKTKTDIFFLNGTAFEDFAALVNCNHSIITVGTFGWWAAWLAGGQVVYYSLYPKTGTPMATKMNKTDYYPPTWIPME